MSRSFILSSNTSRLRSKIFPPLYLDDGQYEIALSSFDTYNSIPNVDDTNNAFYFGEHKTHIPTGAYEIDAILKYMQTQVQEHNHVFAYESNLNTYKATIQTSVPIDFSKPNSIGPLLGFHNKVLPANVKHTSDVIVDVFRVNIIDIQCNIASGNYTNGEPTHSIYAFSPHVAPGFKIHEIPAVLTYYPVDDRVLNEISIKIVDQSGELINFRNERINVRLLLRKSDLK